MRHKLSSLTDDIVQAEDVLATPLSHRLIIDVRLGEPDEELQRYRECHIQGAVHAQIREIFAGEPTPESGNLPLPPLPALQSHLEAWGVDDDTEIILYGPSMALAARAWWVLRWAGFRHVKVLDGGLRSWINQGGPVAQGETFPRARSLPGRLTLTPGHMPQIEVSDVLTLSPDVVLIDARDENSFLAGCIPRACNLPSSEQWTPAMQLRTVKEIQQLYTEIGVLPHSDVVVYCGGGVLSALSVLTLNALGLQPRLYVGSWSEWNKSPSRMALSAAERALSS
jgi:thiosulfate/3-mercaptopyruvate sulfurtransferase